LARPQGLFPAAREGTVNQQLRPQDDLARALGALVINFAFLEEALHDAILITSGCPVGAVNVLTAGLQFRTLVEKFGALCADAANLRVPKPEVEAYCKHLLTLNERRNALVHSAWLVQRGDESTRRVRRRADAAKGFTYAITQATPDQINALAQQLLAAEAKLWELVP
jgi:hypothetical protein